MGGDGEREFIHARAYILALELHRFRNRATQMTHIFKDDSRVAVTELPDHSARRPHVILC